MKKIIIFSLLIMTALVSGLSILVAEETEFATDFYALSGANNSVALENNEIQLTMTDNVVDSRIIYGDATSDYLVDLTNLTLKIKLVSLEKSGRFTISFLGSRDNQPLSSGSEGISFVFRGISDGRQLQVAILDAKTGELIEEMKGVRWSYLGSEETNWDNGIIGILNGQNGSVLNSELTLKFQTDSASSGGTTFRPSMGSSLGVAIPITLFTARNIDIKNLVMMISSGEKLINYNFEDGTASQELTGNDLVFRILSFEEPNTRKYRQNPSRVELIEAISDYIFKSDGLKNGTLSVDDYVLLKNKTFDLTSLRNRDKTIQNKRIIDAKAIINEVTNTINNLKAYAQDYSFKNSHLEDLSTVTVEMVNEAKDAKEIYDNAAIYSQYLSSTTQQEINEIINNIDETFILRAELNILLKDFEDKVGVFKENIETANAQDIIAAVETKKLIETTLFDNLDQVDKNNFTNRYNDANSVLEEALSTHLFAVEKQRVLEYKNQFEILTSNSAKEELINVIAIRPTIDSTTFTTAEKGEITELLENVDANFKNLILEIITTSLNNYSEKVNLLKNREELTEQKITDAENAKYDEDLLDGLVEISEDLSLDISSYIASLYENDRLVEVAKLFLDLTKYHLAVSNINDVSHLQHAYSFHDKALENINNETFKTTEKEEYTSFFNSTSATMNLAAKGYIETAIQALETEMEGDLSLNIQMNKAKSALRQIPSLHYLTEETDYILYETRLNNLIAILKEEDLYYFSTDDSSSWYAKSVKTGVLLTGNVNQGIMNLQEPLSIDGLDIVFDYTKIGRIWAGKVDGKYPQNILVLNFMRDYAKIKDQSQGFSIYLYPNIINELEVKIYGPNRDGQNVLLAQGKISNQIFDDETKPYQVRIRITKEAAPLNCYQIWVNSLKLNVYYRDIINFTEDNPIYIPGYEAGVEIGEIIFLNDKAHLSFVLFGQDLTEEEKTSSITIKKLNEKTFAGYVAPLLPIEMFIDQPPIKMEYAKGEELDLTGLIIRVVMSDGSSKIIDNSLLQIGGFTSSSQGNKIVSLIYTEEDITLTKVIKVMVVDNQNEEPRGNNNLALILGITVGAIALVAVGIGVTFILRKKIKK